MKWFATMLFVLMITASTSQGKERTEYIGEISDSQCAMNVHSLSRSHEEMIKKRTLGTDAASCARACVRRGGEWVLRSGDDVYHLLYQAGVEQFSGQKVKVVGTLDEKTHTIDNYHIEAADSGQ
ncbi:MAG TPA: hypothetical protein VN682_23415 [Terriglobales bacterium]|jgi:hypothetical protein|nr:hypothetical protein [Terriglobales bacterium]